MALYGCYPSWLSKIAFLTVSASMMSWFWLAPIIRLCLQSLLIIRRVSLVAFKTVSTVFHDLFPHFNRWRCVYSNRLSWSMFQHSGYKFKLNSILIRSTSPSSSEHMWVQLLRKTRMLRSDFFCILVQYSFYISGWHSRHNSFLWYRD